MTQLVGAHLVQHKAGLVVDDDVSIGRVVIGPMNGARTRLALRLGTGLRLIGAGNGNHQRRHHTGKREPTRTRDPSLHSQPPVTENRAGEVNRESAPLAVIGMPHFAENQTDGATPCIAAVSPMPAGLAGSRSTPARVTRGSICLRSSSHFALMPYSNQVKPVALPAGRARLATNPALTGSTTATNTIGIVRVACCNAPTIRLPIARMTSGVSATISATFLRMSSASQPNPQRISIRTLRASVQPNCCRVCWNAAMRP